MILRLFNWFLFLSEIGWLLVRLAYSTAECAFRVVVPRSRKSVANNVVVLTGAARGLGREMAKIFADLGAKVVLLDIDQVSRRGPLLCILS